MLQTVAHPETDLSLRQRAAAFLHTARTLPPYVVMAALFPGDHVPFSSLPVSLREAYDFHAGLLRRPGFAQLLDRLEREDLLTLPLMLAASPFDLLRIRRKFRDGTVRLPVTPPDEFPYPSYYLNDFHNQKNGNLSLQAALTYELQISILFLGCNRLMRQAVIDPIPEDPRCRLWHRGVDSAGAAAGAGACDHRGRPVPFVPALCPAGGAPGVPRQHAVPADECRVADPTGRARRRLDQPLRRGHLHLAAARATACRRRALACRDGAGA
jgi:hypothetical protein